jgi:capsule polysaccharide export protein KpsE/RkpR
MSHDKYFVPVVDLSEPNGQDLQTDPREKRERQIERMRLLWENRKFLFRWVVWGLLVSIGVAFLIPARYEATTQLMPPENQSGSGAAALLSLVAGRGSGAAGGLGSLAGEMLGAKNSGQLFVGILSTRTVQDRLIQQFDLNRLYGESKAEDTRIALARHTSISEDRKSGIISIAVTDHDAKRAAAMSTAYVQELDRLVAQVSTSSARRERIFLEERLRAVKQELNTAAGKFSEFASKNTAIDIPAQGKAMVEAAARLQGELIFVQSELRGLEAIYTDQNVRVRSLRARVKELQAQLEKLGGDANMSTEALAKDSSSMYPSIRKLPLLGVTYADLYQQTKIHATVFELLTQQYELAKVQEAKEIPSVKVLDAAVVPTKISFPPRILVSVSGTIAAFVCGCVWLFASRRWNSIDSQDSGKQLAEEVASATRDGFLRILPGTAIAFRKIFKRDQHARQEVSTESERSSLPGASSEIKAKSFSSAAGKGSD